VTPAILLGVLVAGALGALARYLVDGLAKHHTRGRFPWGTFVVNITGSLLFGLVTGAGLDHALAATPRIWMGTGFCGAYTTFSTFTFQTIQLLEEGAVADALRNALANVMIGVAAAAAGLALAAL
jgi:CrcB protein